MESRMPKGMERNKRLHNQDANSQATNWWQAFNSLPNYQGESSECSIVQEEDIRQQWLVYYMSMSLDGAKINYSLLHNAGYALILLAQRLKLLKYPTWNQLAMSGEDS